MTNDEALARIRQAAEEGRVSVADADRTDALYAECLDVAEAFIGHRRCMLTDESAVCDFCPDEEDMEKARQCLGIAIDRDEYVVDVAARLKAQRQAGVV